jgi:hypothetical protein
MGLEDGVGRWDPPPDGRPGKRDRRPAVLYGPQRRAEASWCPGEAWALSHDYLVGMELNSSTDDLTGDPASQPSLRTLAWLCIGRASSGASGAAVIFEHRPQPNTHAALAVVAAWLRRVNAPFYVRDGSRPARFREVRDSQREGWARSISRERLSAEVRRLGEAAAEVMTAAARTDPAHLLSLGEGPQRDVRLARELALERLAHGWPKRRVREYLELHGFTNSSGTVGRWSHGQLTRLLAGLP